jgi:hypothetical protein
MLTSSSQAQTRTPSASLPLALVLLIIGKVASPQKPNEHNAKMGREYFQGVKQEWQFHNSHTELCGFQHKP